MKKLLVIAMIVLSASARRAAAQADPWVTSRVWVTGSDKSVWVTGTSTVSGHALPLVQIWNGPAGAIAPLPTLSNYIPPISGNPIALAADGGGLRVLYADLTQCDYFSDKPYSPGPKWLDQSSRPPLAWCGDATEPVTYALIATSSIPEIPPATTTDREDDDDDSYEPEASPIATSRPVTEFCLLMLRGGLWTRVDGPEGVSNLSRVWMCARQGIVHLIYENDGAMRSVKYDGQNWSAPIEAPSPGKIQQAWAGHSASGPVLVVAVGRTDERCELKLLTMSAEDHWQIGAKLRENLDFIEVTPRSCGIAVAGDQIVVARATGDGGIEQASVSLDGSEPLRFVPLSMQRPQISQQGTVQETVALVIGLVVLTFVMWTRRQQLALPAAVPQGMQIAAAWRRVMATFVDLSPGILIALPWMMRTVPELFQGLPLQEVQTLLESPAVQSKLLPIQIAVVVIYGVWCWLWEAFTRATPGKFFFGCRVLSIDGNTASQRQIMLRNICRMLMVGIGPSGWIITIMMMVMLSRNRQRVGDLLAFTIVVEEAPPPMEDSFLGGPDDGPTP